MVLLQCLWGLWVYCQCETAGSVAVLPQLPQVLLALPSLSLSAVSLRTRLSHIMCLTGWLSSPVKCDEREGTHCMHARVIVSAKEDIKRNVNCRQRDTGTNSLLFYLPSFSTRTCSKWTTRPSMLWERARAGSGYKDVLVFRQQYLKLESFLREHVLRRWRDKLAMKHNSNDNNTISNNNHNMN